MAALYEATMQRAEAEGWSHRHVLEHLCQSEATDREQRRIGRLLAESGLPEGKTLGNLDEALLPAKVRRQLPTLMEGGFVSRSTNILAFGLPERGTHFLAAKRDLRLKAELKKLDRYEVVILDDIGYVQQNREEMEVLFTFLAERYERRCVMISSNLVFSQWDQIFKDKMTTMAAIDRLVHHSIILEFDGSSLRMKKNALRTETVSEK